LYRQILLPQNGFHFLVLRSTAAVELVKRLACPSCEVTVLDMHDPQVAGRAKELGVHSVRR